ncbi:YqzE-like protein [Scopulibacillus darangshiensis]|uniref:YqzE-like protein n=1 Tax=Scopulibacillus darangshiensis TaxID=442528 RepID=A0A4R2P9X8_9BACL|nr:YqzE family protein [Scopulibacillus darangshiensis]TCP31158.1 YqzE-like protein [Scopulibacillus darangshiensis]
MKSNDYVKFLTEQFVQYMEQPSSVRKDVKRERRQNRKPLRNELFGLIPNACSYYVEGIKSAFKKK